MKTALFALLLLPGSVLAQAFDNPAAPQPTPPPVPPKAEEKKPAGSAEVQGGAGPIQGRAGGTNMNLPEFDPGTENVTWNGKIWNITNNRLFRARFEKYLASPEANGPDDQAYRQTFTEIQDALNPAKNAGKPNLPKAVSLLPVASQYPLDAKLCDSLASAIWSVWVARKNNAALDATNAELEKRADTLRRNFDVASSSNPLLGGAGSPAARASSSGGGQNPQGGGQNPQGGGGSVPNRSNGSAGAGNSGGPGQQMNFGIVSGYIKKVGELEAVRAANKVKQEFSEVEAKLQFQTLLFQFLLQRRFEHAVIACRLYRLLFTDGDMNLKIEKNSEVGKLFNQGAGFNPSIGNCDAMANEAIRDVEEGVQAFKFLAERGDMESASKRLSESFMIGEYMPAIRTLPRREKARVLDFVRDSFQLVSAIEVKDYALAEELVKKLRVTAKDFDASKPTAAIETARSVAGMHINKARVAATKGDSNTVSEELKAATELWPNNPELKTVASMIFNRGDNQAQALNDLDSLIGQKNYRQIFLDQGKYIAAAADKPDYQAKLKPILEDMAKVQMVLAQSEKLAQVGDKYGAWEAVETVGKDYPNDPEINSRRASLSAQASDLAHALSKADEFEDRKQHGAALAWFLKARKLYPQSQFAKDGVERVSTVLMPDGK